jgi:hypothetical protein
MRYVNVILNNILYRFLIYIKRGSYNEVRLFNLNVYNDKHIDVLYRYFFRSESPTDIGIKTKKVIRFASSLIIYN